MPCRRRRVAVGRLVDMVGDGFDRAICTCEMVDSQLIRALYSCAAPAYPDLNGRPQKGGAGGPWLPAGVGIGLAFLGGRARRHPATAGRTDNGGLSAKAPSVAQGDGAGCDAAAGTALALSAGRAF
ncbi:hypothetical protein [Sphingobium lactosutens]|uniref:hypothetical protein n=1 Tax=Sphingobium lactosutens TaxID=522773 RepID=UPI0015BC7B4D|nr:hypothetical protein [Sphingobium lactosutens]